MGTRIWNQLMKQSKFPTKVLIQQNSVLNVLACVYLSSNTKSRILIIVSRDFNGCVKWLFSLMVMYFLDQISSSKGALTRSYVNEILLW